MTAESDWIAAARSVAQAQEKMAEAFGRAQGDVAADFYDDVVETSPVRFGYYRSSHVAAVGTPDGPETNIYEHPERPPSDGPFPARSWGSILEPPDGGAARSAFQAAGAPGVTLWVENPILYGAFLEWGTARIEPRLIYTSAASRIDSIAAARAAEASGLSVE